MSHPVLPPHPGPVVRNAPPPGLRPLPESRFTLHNEGPLLFALLRRFPALSMTDYRVLLVSPIEVWGNGKCRLVSEYEVAQQRQRRIQGALTARGATCVVGRNFQTFHIPQTFRLAVIPFDPGSHLSTPYQRIAAALAWKGWRIISERALLKAIGFCDNKEAFERGPNGVNGQSPGAASLRAPRPTALQGAAETELQAEGRGVTEDPPVGGLNRDTGDIKPTTILITVVLVRMKTPIQLAVAKLRTTSDSGLGVVPLLDDLLGATLVRSKHTLNPHAKPFVPRYPIRVLSVGSSSSSGSSRTDNGASSPPTTIYDPPRLRADSPPFFPGLLWGTATATSVGLRWVDQQQGEQGGAGSRIATLESRFGESVGPYPAMGFETPYPHEGACFSGDPADPWLFATHRYQGDPWMPPDLSGQLWLATPDGWSSVPPLQDHWAAPFNPPAPPHFGYPDVVPPYADMPSPPMPWSEPYITPWTKPYFTPWSESTTTSPVIPEQYGQPLFLPLPPPPLPPIWVTAPSPSLTQNGYSSDENPHFHLPLNLMDSPSSLYSPVSRPAFRPVPIRRPGTDITPPLSPPQSERNIDHEATGSGDVGGNEDPLADLYVDLHHKMREEMYGRKSWKSYQEVRARRTVSSPANLSRSVVCSF
ncbi:hypothetical protein JCM24511_05094 [Saitozyma sp. JCM 24511]|nr:hypothetical protein JCM24511_05094 [Saitozyma sp. JCM 24511]